MNATYLDQSAPKYIVGTKRGVLVASTVTFGVIVAAIAAGTAMVSFNDYKTNMTMTQSTEIRTKEVLESLDKSTGWINANPIKSTDLKGKVVLIEFCTYTCINWIRTIPYVRAWADKYKDQGLVVIGIHSPEFEFEKNFDNVRREIGTMNINFPIATDNNYAIWKAFDNAYWPAIYLVDANGRVRYHQFGEGNYEETGKMIQQLLNEAGSEKVEHGLIYVKGIGVESAPDWGNMRSPENYVGYERTENFSSPDGAELGISHAYTLPSKLELNQWALSGHWVFGNQSILLKKPNGRMVYRFYSRDLHLVMGSSDGEKTIRFRILMDGKPPGSAHGVDVDNHGYGTIRAQRLYQLIRQQTPIIEREFEIEFFDAGVEVFSFTFG